MKKKIVLAVTGASGAIYAYRLLKKLEGLQGQITDLGIVLSDSGKKVWEYELKNTNYLNSAYSLYDNTDFLAPFASGSANYDAMVVCPCSMGTLGRIAAGIADNLIGRAADVMLKEQKKLILVVRETPFNLIHLANMKKIAEAGGMILPASPSFYSNPKTIEELVDTIVERIVQHLGLQSDFYSWNPPSKETDSDVFPYQ